MTLNELARNCHAANQHWWHDPKTGERLNRNKSELLMLIVSEISEAMEGERKDLMDDKLPHRKMAEVELADALIRIFDYAKILATTEHCAATLLLLMFPDHKMAAGMLNEGLVQGIERRISLHQSKMKVSKL